MGNIRCADGGSASQGENFTFINEGAEPCTLGGFSSFMTVDTNPVPAKTSTGPGTSGATILNGITSGNYEYTASCRKKSGNPKITVGLRCANGGSASQGENLIFINEGEEPCTLGGFSSFMTVDTNPVPAKTPEGPGTSGATILTDTAPGDYEYTASCNKKRGNPSIHVESGKP